MRAILITLASLAALSSAAQTHDHYTPAALEAEARRAMGEGDLTTACVLLSRASQLAPHDARIARAWQDYEARQHGRAVSAPAPAPAPVPAATPKPAAVGPEPPPLWPAK